MSTFAGTTADIWVDPVDHGPDAGVHIDIFNADPRNGGQPVTDLTDYDGNPLPGYAVSDATGLVAFKTVATYGSVWGRDPAGNVYRFPSAETISNAADAGEQYPAMQTAVDQAKSSASAAQTAATDAQSKANQAIAASPDAIALLLGSFGDVLTPDVDITPAVQAAVDALPATGGRIIFPHGAQMRFNGPVDVSKDNVIFDFNGSLMYKDGASNFYAFLLHSFRGTGYGAGPTGCKFLNGTLKGSFADGRGFAIQAHHARDLLIEDVIFQEGMINAHYLEIAGCDRVTLNRCQFKGCVPGSPTDNTDHAWFNESVQLDYSYYDGVALDGGNLSWYDGLPCKDVTFTDCKWLPLTVGATTYPAPMITGQHVRMDGQWIENVKLVRCYAEGLQATWNNSGRTTAGWIHGFGLRNWKIEDCTFVNTTGHGACVFICDGTTGAIGFPVNSTTLTSSAPPTSTIPPMPAQDITIEGCTFRGFNSPERDQIIEIKGYDASDSNYPTEIHGAGIRVTGNFVEATHATTPPDNTIGQRFCGIYYMDGVVFSGNSGKQNAQILWMANVTGFAVVDNTFPTVYDEAIIIYNACTEGTVKGNMIYGAGALQVNGATKVDVSGNTLGFLVAGYQNYVVGIEGTPSGILCSANLIDTKGSAATYGIRVTSGGANVVVNGNAACTSLAAGSAFNFSSGVQSANNYTMAA